MHQGCGQNEIRYPLNLQAESRIKKAIFEGQGKVKVCFERKADVKIMAMEMEMEMLCHIRPNIPVAQCFDWQHSKASLTILNLWI